MCPCQNVLVLCSAWGMLGTTHLLKYILEAVPYVLQNPFLKLSTLGIPLQTMLFIKAQALEISVWSVNKTNERKTRSCIITADGMRRRKLPLNFAFFVFWQPPSICQRIFTCGTSSMSSIFLNKTHYYSNIFWQNKCTEDI